MLAFGIDKDDLGKITITILGAKLQTNDQELGEIVLVEDDTPSEYEAAAESMFPEVEDIKKLFLENPANIVKPKEWYV